MPTAGTPSGDSVRRWRHAVWVSDVFAWRGSPAAWNEGLMQVVDASVATPTPEELTRLRRLANPAVAVLTPKTGESLRVAVASEHAAALLGPYGPRPAGQ
jgi:hypothetical protein